MVLPNYKEMYLTLFRETTKAIAALQRAQCQTEELFVGCNTADSLIILQSADKQKEENAAPK